MAPLPPAPCVGPQGWQNPRHVERAAQMAPAQSVLVDQETLTEMGLGPPPVSAAHPPASRPHPRVPVSN